MKTSGLFSTYRHLGLICDQFPPCVYRQGNDTFITTSVGKVTQTYNIKNLRLLMVSEEQQNNISAVAVEREEVYTADGDAINHYHRGKLASVLRQDKITDNNTDQSDIRTFILTEEYIVGCTWDAKVLVWTKKSEQFHTRIWLAEGCVPVCILSPKSYLDKVCRHAAHAIISRLL